MFQPTYNLYPEIDSYNKSWLQVNEVHQIYYEESGNPDGSPVVFLHGGPGSGCNPGQRRFFDPKHYRIILLDQRGCGRSKPQGELSNNTTDALVSDLEALRLHLNIKHWHIFGGSWGSTLALAYATQHPNNVISMALRGIFLSRSSELSWFLGEIKYFYPDVWHTLIEYLPLDERDDVLTAFEQRVFSDNVEVSCPAAEAWNNYEGSIMRLMPPQPKDNTKDTTNKKTTPATIEQAKLTSVSQARIQIHYVRNHCFIDGEAILKAAEKLSHIPTAIVQGRYDMVCPPETAWRLSKVMPHADFTLVPDAGHSAMESGTISGLVSATEKFKAL